MKAAVKIEMVKQSRIDAKENRKKKQVSREADYFVTRPETQVKPVKQARSRAEQTKKAQRARRGAAKLIILSRDPKHK